ncbi:MAG: hypothetical protein GWN00_25015, partial [Aliifodinibius sp.]|nr:carboxypeptidase-like regulatory domain-containing protein [Fodinibius sp.]NIV14125.1 hypothetical protein [Fodinibius sp.]NIY27946.1 hypothetical protein [Fodinibius sp.]
MSRTLKFIGFLFAILLTGCTSDAPHDNPLDPANGIHITGRVERLYSTAPLSGATLTLKPGNRIARSTMDGTYQIENISPGNYTLLCSAEGFLTDSVTLTLNRSDTTIFKLNALPYLNHISLTTQHISNSFPADDDFFVQSTAVAGDPDNTSDVELVRYEIDGFAFADTLTLIDISAQGKTFTAELQPGELGLMSLEQLIGKPFNFYVEDLPGAVVREPEQFIIRIIDEVPTTLAPQGNSVNPPFQFEWEPMNLPF